MVAAGLALALFATIAVSLAASVGGGGSGETDGLAGDFARVGERLQSDTAALKETGQAPPDETKLAEVIRVYTALRDATRRARDGYRALEVRDEMKANKARLVALMTERVRLIDQIITAAGKGDAATAASAVKQLVEGATAVSRAQADLSAQIAACGAACD